MLNLRDEWLWDFWLVDDGARYHVFFLYASRALVDPDARHFRASIGHAVSSDLLTWQRVEDAFGPAAAPAFDDLATWTGSVVRHPEGRWFMFYTGASRGPHDALMQSVGYAVSDDLMSWRKVPGPSLCADAQWYEVRTDAVEPVWQNEEAFRDPWVFADEGGEGWHMLLTARSHRGPAADPSDRLDRGVVGHARSPDLERWRLCEPLSGPGAGFGEIEAVQIATISGRKVLTFSCRASKASSAIQSTGTPGGIWVLPIESSLGPFDFAEAQLLVDDQHYVGKFIADRDTGDTKFLAAVNVIDGQFVGVLSDPWVATWSGTRLVLAR